MLSAKMVTPVESLGYEFDATVAHGVNRYQDKDCEHEERMIIVGFLRGIKPVATDLEKGEFLNLTYQI